MMLLLLQFAKVKFHQAKNYLQSTIKGHETTETFFEKCRTTDFC